MTKETLERLLNEACELLIIFEDGNAATNDDKARINAIFNEIKYADDIDNELALTLSERIDKHSST
jgi:spore coat polysaccharide biosynthesis predicted glycosyltransferase SpsG